MNKSILMGRLVRNPDVRYTGGDNSYAVARFTLAVDRKFKKQNDEKTADFIDCVAFGRNAQFIEKYLQKGIKVVIVGRIQTGTYEREGRKIKSVNVVAEETYFAESKSAHHSSDSYQEQADEPARPKKTHSDKPWMDVDDAFEVDDLPFV